MSRYDGVHGMAEGYQSEVASLRRQFAAAEAERDEARAEADKMQMQINGWQDHLQRVHGIACDYGQPRWEPEDVEDTAMPQPAPTEPATEEASSD